MNPTAGQVASEFRRIADALEADPDTEVQAPMVTFYCNSYLAEDKGKAVFLNVVRLLPRPLAEKFTRTDIEIKNPDKDVVWLRAYIDLAAVCEIVEPAKPPVYQPLSLLGDV